MAARVPLHLHLGQHLHSALPAGPGPGSHVRAQEGASRHEDKTPESLTKSPKLGVALGLREKAALCQSAGPRFSPSTEMSWMANLRMMVQIIPRVIFALPSTISARRERGRG